jgi:two-component system cell cycle sensor histidine kinase PleC
VGFGKRLRVQRSADVRVLKAQLDLTAEALRSTRLSAPLWAFAIAVMASDEIGLVGGKPFLHAMIMPAILAVTMVLLSHIVSFYKQDTSGSTGYERTRGWFGRMVGLQIVVSAVWGLMPWLLWDGASDINHVFLAASTISILAGLVVSRASHMDMFLASLIPFTAMAALRFALGNSALDHGAAIVIPLVSLQLFFDGGRIMHRLDEDSRLRFQVEDLARELEETRDDALRKRFEAETANASKTAFLANMSHELRTPLNAILGFSEIIAQECFGPTGSPRYKEYAGDIHSSGAHLLSLINDLLDVAKIEAGKMDIEPEPLDAARTFDLALKLISAKAREKRQQLTIQPHRPCSPTSAHSSKS